MWLFKKLLELIFFDCRFYKIVVLDIIFVSIKYIFVIREIYGIEWKIKK